MIQSRATSRSASVPAPIGGWNARDPLAAMPATDAVILDNWYPTASDVRVRQGMTEWATGLPGRVETVMQYSSGTTDKMYAIAGGEVFDVTTAGAVGSAETTFTNSRIQHEHFTTAAGNYLMCCNGVDAPQHYNGSAWATPSITSVTGGASTLVQPCSFKSRLFFVQVDTLSVWYLAVNSIAGTATELNLGGIFQDGGHIVAMGNWTLDAGSGVDDHVVFVTSNGEVAVYAGTDPTSSSTWSLVGVYRIGAPVGRRCLVKYAGDLLIICQDGVYPLSAALQSTRLDQTQAITDKIRSAISTATGIYKSNFGWQLMPYPKENALLINVPLSTTVSHQYVMNALTGAWCRFKGWDAASMCLFNDDLYYGGANVVYRAWYGSNDDGNDINTDAKQAFSDFGAPSLVKHFKMVKPYIGTNSTLAPGIVLNVDYSDRVVIGTGDAVPVDAGVWGTSLWGTAKWGGSLQTLKKWRNVSGVGFTASLRMATNTKNSDARWYSTDFLFEVGGVL